MINNCDVIGLNHKKKLQRTKNKKYKKIKGLTLFEITAISSKNQNISTILM